MSMFEKGGVNVGRWALGGNSTLGIMTCIIVDESSLFRVTIIKNNLPGKVFLSIRRSGSMDLIPSGGYQPNS